ncbi:helix-turn-helix domain-containing protein [Streptococcus castoreus]
MYVSRQTISNWENNKTYPDIQSLITLSNLFQVTLGQLVERDFEEMKKMIKTEDRNQLKKMNYI